MMTYNDPTTVRYVQQKLKLLGYVNLSEVDGKLGDSTLDEVLVFRRRNNLPLAAVIDDDFLKALETAPPKTASLRQITATEQHIEKRVEVMGTVATVEKQAWWAKLWAAVVGIPSGLLALLVAMVNNLDEAITALQPVKNFLTEVAWNVPGWAWFMGATLVALVLAINAMRTARLAEEAKDQLVEGYQKGTVKNDVVTPAEKDADVKQQEKETVDEPKLS